VEKFNRKAIQLLTTGQAVEVPALVKRSVLLQLFGPRGPLDAKLGLAYMACGEFEHAIACFDEAIPTAPATERPALQTGLVKALFVTSDFARAEAEGKPILDRVTRLPELLVAVARARVGLGKLDDETRKLLDEADKLSPGPDVALMVTLTRIELALATGRKPGEVPPDADSSQPFIRSWIHLVRGLVRKHKGQEEKAEESFKKAVTAMPHGFAAAEAKGHVTAARPADEAVPEAGAGRDPAVKRKRKRRR
jgi:tetratricopeptide (TPR) repeat protein